MEDIVEWNIKKIDTGVFQLHKRMRQICLKLEHCHYDAQKANHIVNNMLTSMDYLEEDVNRLYYTLGIMDDGFTGRGFYNTPGMLDDRFAPTGLFNSQEIMDDRFTPKALYNAPVIVDDRFAPTETFKKGMFDTRRSKSMKNIKEIETMDDLPYIVHDDQTVDRAAHDKVAKQVKDLENIVLSGNIAERIEKLEKDPTSKETQQQLERVEGEVLGGVRTQIKTLEERTGTEISGKIASLEKFVHRIVKTVFGGESGMDEHSENCVIRKLNDFEKLLNEGKADIRSLDQKVERKLTERAYCDDDNESMACSSIFGDVYKPYGRDLTGIGATGDAVEFSVKVNHSGPWDNGAVIREIASVQINLGDAFDEDKCWFVPPVDGSYKLFFRIKRFEGGLTNVEAWTCQLANCGWIERIFQLQLNGQTRYRSRAQIQHLDAGVAVRLRVSGGTEFSTCTFKGRLLNAGSE